MEIPSARHFHRGLTLINFCRIRPRDRRRRRSRADGGSGALPPEPPPGSFHAPWTSPIAPDRSVSGFRFSFGISSNLQKIAPLRASYALFLCADRRTPFPKAFSGISPPSFPQFILIDCQIEAHTILTSNFVPFLCQININLTFLF